MALCYRKPYSKNGIPPAVAAAPSAPTPNKATPTTYD